ncbi:MAG: hypothetical protein RLZZ339_1950 [Cyanobacteriota bacterium]|jgi:hypothetical protein
MREPNCNKLRVFGRWADLFFCEAKLSADFQILSVIVLVTPI